MAGFWIEIYAQGKTAPWLTGRAEGSDARTTSQDFAVRAAQTLAEMHATGRMTEVTSVQAIDTVRVWVASSLATSRPGGTPVFEVSRDDSAEPSPPVGGGR